MAYRLASRLPVRIPDIRRRAMIACQILEKLLALAALSPPPSKSTQPTAKTFEYARARRRRRVRPNAEHWRRRVGRLRWDMTRVSNNVMSAIWFVDAAAATQLLACMLHCSGRRRC